MKYRIIGGRKLEGDLRIKGAKNSVLPILAATLLNKGISVLHDCPRLKDVESMIEILKYLGCKVAFEDSKIIVDSSGVIDYHIPDKLMRSMRSSIFLMGALVSRNNIAQISFPGGCDIGHRPIDLHLKSLRKLNINITESYGYIHCETTKINGSEIHLDIPSVGATENIMLASCIASGTTVIGNAAKEPEIEDLQNFLNSMGANIKGAGSNTIVINGVNTLHDTEYKIISDRIVAGTYLIAAAITKGEITLTNVIKRHINSLISKMGECGYEIKSGNDYVKLMPLEKPKAVDMIITLPFPGFPTDLQAPMVSLLTIADGTSIITETIFDNRFKYTEELVRMGANIKVDGRIAVIKGVDKLTGTSVVAKDLRGGAALVLAGLGANGVTIVEDIEHIDRGYEKFDVNLRNLGADIEKIM